MDQLIRLDYSFSKSYRQYINYGISTSINLPIIVWLKLNFKSNCLHLLKKENNFSAHAKATPIINTMTSHL